MARLQNHHIIPQELFDTVDGIDLLIDSGFDMDNRNYNIIGLPDATTVGPFQTHNGSHPGYTAFVRAQVERIAQSGVTGDAAIRELVGLTNTLKSMFADPAFDPVMNNFDTGGSLSTTEVAALWNDGMNQYLRDNGVNDIRNLPEWRAASEYGAFVMTGQHGIYLNDIESPNYVAGDSAFNTFRYDVDNPLAQQLRLEEFRANLTHVLNNLPDPDPTKQSVRDQVQAATRALANREPLDQVMRAINDEIPVYRYTTPDGVTHALISPSIMADIDGLSRYLDRGSLLVDGISLTLLGLGLERRGVLDDFSFSAMSSLLLNSNARRAVVGVLDDIALDLGKEALFTAAASMLGVGLLWKGYEIYQSIDGLIAALEFYNETDPDPRIDALLNSVETAKGWLASWFGPLETAQPDFNPNWQEYTDAIYDSFYDDAVAGGGPVIQEIGTALYDYISANADGYPAWITARLDEVDPENIDDLMLMLAGMADHNNMKLSDMFERALLQNSTLFQENPALFEMLRPTACFVAGTPVAMADGTEKPIEAIEAGDEVLSYTATGKLVGAKVKRTFVNHVSEVLDFWGTRVTPGHVFLCGDGKYAGLHVPLIDILRTDGAVVLADGRKVRAATGCEVGSEGDRLVWAAVGTRRDSGRLDIRDARQLRAGTRVRLEDGRDVSVLDILIATGAAVSSGGMVRDASGMETMFHWTFGYQLPRPEDYILVRSGTDLDRIWRAAEWEDVAPFTPYPGLRGRVQ